MLNEGRRALTKLYRSNEYIDKENPTPGQRYRTEVPYHYHAARGLLTYIVSGEGIEKIETEEFPVKAGDVLFIPANKRHTIMNRSNKDLRYLEFYPPIERDFIEVAE